MSEHKGDEAPVIFLGCPVYDKMNVETVISLTRLMGEFKTISHFFGSSVLHHARNKIVEKFLETDADYLLFVDADMVFTPHTLESLLKRDVDIVSALYFGRVWPYKTNAGHCSQKTGWKAAHWEEVGPEFVEMDYVGMGCCLIKREVFMGMEKPWFDYRKHKDGTMLGEDVTFCLKAKEKGYKVYVDGEKSIGHMGQTMVSEAHFLAARESLKSNGGQ